MNALAPSAGYVGHVMGTAVSLALRGRHTRDAPARAAWEQVMAELREVDEVFSTYRADSWITRLDRGLVSVAECPPEVGEVLALAEVARAASGGAFDVRLPGPDGQVHLDPSGVVKGWAVERAAAHLRALPETDFALSAGGDMTCRTLDASGTPWRIGVEDPADPSRLVAVIPLPTGAVATSATTHRGPHLLDARTGRPPVGVASVTVIAPTLTWADIDATAAYAHGPDAAAWLSQRPGRSGLVVAPDGHATVVDEYCRALLLVG